MAVSLLLVALTAAVYAPVRQFGFIPFDDPENVSDEPHVAAGLTADSLWWALTGCTMGHWVPLTRLTYLLDRRLCGLDPGVMHVEDAALHAATSAVLFLFLAEATGAVARSAAVAAVFAVHPMHVESVAWITERRDVLSTPLLLGSMWAYVRYVRAVRPAVRWGAYGAAVGLYAASLSAKAMGMTAPVLLLLLDAWPLGRLQLDSGARSRAACAGAPDVHPGLRPAERRSTAHGHLAGSSGWRRALLDKVPFAALAVPVALMAAHAQRSTGAALPFALLPASERVANAVVTTVIYMAKLAVPARLSVVYVAPVDGWPVWQVVGAGSLIAAAAVAVVAGRRRWPYLAFGFGWFVVALSPVSGVAQSGFQSMADRYTYLPSIGLFTAAVWALADVARSVRRPGFEVGRRAGPVVAAGAIAGLAVAGRVQVGYWRDVRTLFTHAADVTDDNWFADYELGMQAFDANDVQSALALYGRSQSINPSFSPSLDGLADCVMKVDPEKSIPMYQAVIDRDPADPLAFTGLGYAQLATRRPVEAERSLTRALQLDPTIAPARRALDAVHAWLAANPGPLTPAPIGSP